MEPEYATCLSGNGALMRPHLIAFDERSSEAGQILSIWRSRSKSAGAFTSTAYPNWEFVFSWLNGTTSAVLRGPELVATVADLPASGSWLGIRFRTGAFLRGVNHAALRDRTIDLEMVGHRHFRLGGMTYEVPNFCNADCFVERLARSGHLGLDHHVVSALQNGFAFGGNARTMQRRFISTTGLSRQAIETIERARYAATMLRAGRTISDTIDVAGYCDQSQLTRSLKRLIGTTPAALRHVDSRPQLSFLSDMET